MSTARSVAVSPTVTVARRAGEHLVGAKLALTSRAKQRTKNVAQPIVGLLTDAMLLGAVEEQALRRTAQPRVDPEVAFQLGRGLDRPLTSWTGEQASRRSTRSRSPSSTPGTPPSGSGCPTSSRTTPAQPASSSARGPILDRPR